MACLSKKQLINQTAQWDKRRNANTAEQNDLKTLPLSIKLDEAVWCRMRRV
jgi:hypothetical protein